MTANWDEEWIWLLATVTAASSLHGAIQPIPARLLEVAAAVGRHGVELTMPDAPTDKALEAIRGYVPWDGGGPGAVMK